MAADEMEHDLALWICFWTIWAVFVARLACWLLRIAREEAWLERWGV